MPRDRQRSPAERAILELLGTRAPDKSICPSDAARALDPSGWRARMDAVRDAAVALASEGLVEITQKGEPVRPPFRGPIRIRRPRGDA